MAINSHFVPFFACNYTRVPVIIFDLTNVIERQGCGTYKNWANYSKGSIISIILHNQQGRTLSLLKLNPVRYLPHDEAKQQNRPKINK
jgi:hypothetical protein